MRASKFNNLKKRNFKACASGKAVVVELRPKTSKEKEISGFQNEQSLNKKAYQITYLIFSEIPDLNIRII
jgi:hypothetical protein